ncbi:hypothetical protein KFL_002770050 [Klebsormidium nitens]|uniref:MYND-type domain-containing protein n=1 Tax=Klebsormidium nitens TaxID=105231 RepID=A0A1Y1IDR3_KLENI|nr:hypothetical protein KFL_002770050 [Klebsormidium nitens]|eukprot:GAQ86228.1 hypothetical protein KFL_002770050 [Klebsormidium nitens]
MANAGRDPVPNFLDLIQKEKWGRVADEFEKLVEGCKAAGLEPGKEQELRLRSNKAFKKMSKLMENQEVVRGVLSILTRSPRNAVQVMHSLGYIAACAQNCFALKEVFEQRLPQQLVASFPLQCLIQALRLPMNGEDNIRKLLGMVPVKTLGAWLVALLGEVGQMARLLANRGEREATTGAHECAGLLLHLLQQPELLRAFSHSGVGPSIEKAVQDLLPSLANHPEANAQGSNALLRISQLKMESELTLGPKLPLTDFTAMRQLLRQIEGSSGRALGELVLLFRAEMEGRTVFDHVAVLQHCDEVRRIHHALRTGLESAVPSEGLQNILNMVSLFLGIADLSSSPVGFDPIGFSLLSCADRVLENQLVRSSPNHLLEAFVYCFNSGDALQEKRAEVARVVIKCLDTDVPERLAGVIGWQFLAVLGGAIPQFRTSGFAVGEGPAPLYLLKYGAQFRARHRPVRTSNEEINGQGSKLARLALRAFRQLGFSFEMPGTYPSSAALVLERLCRDSPKLLTASVLKETDLIVELLEQAYSKLAGASGGPPRNPMERILAEQLADLCSALSSIVKQCLESSEVDRESFIQVVARGKALGLCRGVMRRVRAAGTALPVFLEPPYRAPGQSSLAARLENLVKELWDKIALPFELKACSNAACAIEVIESRKKTFKKCSVCGNVQYCTKNCQLVHWKKEHKEQCKKPSIITGV